MSEQLKIAHVAAVTPKRCGLYETTRDLVAAEREIGIDSFIVDPRQPTLDRGVPIRCASVGECDLLVNHSGLGPYDNSGKPVVHCLHGRPESSFRLERLGQSDVYSYLLRIRHEEQFKRFVTFWPETVPYWRMLLPSVEVVSAPVDLKAWTPDGPSGYDFHGHKAKFNVVCTDGWREDVTPFNAVHAFYNSVIKRPDAKLHLYGVPDNRRGIDALLLPLKERGCLGEVLGWVDGLANVYRAADLLITSHDMATRSVREARACGCITDCAHGLSIRKEGVSYDNNARKIAEEFYDSLNTAKQMLRIYEEVLGE